jgi:hypothetical protein
VPVRPILLSLSALLLVSPGVHAAGPVVSPQKGSHLRKEILDAVRPGVERKLNAPIEFKVDDLKVSGDWAFARLTPQRPGGAAIDVARTPMGKLEIIDGVHTEAVLRLVGGAWRVQALEVGATDVWYTDWCGRLPKAMFRIGNEPTGTCDH